MITGTQRSKLHERQLLAERLWAQSVLEDQSGNARKAARLLLRAARLGSASACLNLAVAYHDGHGVSRSTKKAVDWYRRAIALGNTAALGNMGILRRDQGRFGLAAHWFRRAIKSDDGDALLLLARLYLDREGLSRRVRQLLHQLGVSPNTTESSREEGAILLETTSTRGSVRR
jgi:TPR repeat protein